MRRHGLLVLGLRISDAAAEGLVELGLRTSEAAALGFTPSACAITRSFVLNKRRTRANRSHRKLFMCCLVPHERGYAVAGSEFTRGRVEESFGNSFSAVLRERTHKAGRRQVLTFATTIRNGVIGWLCSRLPESVGIPSLRTTARSGGAMQTFHIEIIKPSHYDKDGYVIQWWKAWIPSN